MLKDGCRNGWTACLTLKSCPSFPNLLVFLRTDLHNSRSRVLVVSNFNTEPQRLALGALRPFGLFQQEAMRELCSGERIAVESDAVMVPPLACCWLID